MDRTFARLLVVQSVLAFANSMAAVFAMVYFLEHGFSFADVVVLNVVAFGLSAAGCVAIAWWRPVRGRTLMAVGLGALIVSYIVYLVLDGWALFLVVAVTWGLYIPFFYLAFNGLVIDTTRAADRGRKLGILVLAVTLVAIVGPTVGGAIVEGFAPVGYAVLFGAASLILVVDLALLWRLAGAREVASFGFAFEAVGARTAAALLGEGAFEGLAFGVLPLIAYAFEARGLRLGSLFSLFALAGGVVTVSLGALSDRLRNRRPFLLAGAAASAFAGVLVAASRDLPSYAVAASVLSVTSSLAPTILYAITVERLPDRPRQAIATREVLLNAGRAASLSVCLALLFAGVAIEGTFLVAAGSVALVALGSPRALR